jgi:EAL domain-containing protein (putative c-di-GMP-specific phosphodiesterase class I)
MADDDPEFGRLLVDLASRLDCGAVVVRDFESLRAEHDRHEPEVMILSLQLGDHDAIDMLRYLAQRRCRSYIVLVGGGDLKILESAERVGRNRRLNMLPSLERPVTVVALRSLLRGIIDARPEITEAELAEGLSACQFVPYFQPVIDLKGRDSKVVRAEVLARWDHPFHGVLRATDFIDVAEKYGMAADLTAALLVQALGQVAACREGGLTLPISLNVSASSLHDLTLPDTLAEIVAEHDFRNDLVTIELTESAMTEERVETLDILTRLRMKGFRLSMDDFGTGYSTLLELVRLPFNEIKIDPRFIDQVGVRRESGIVIRSAIGLAHGLGMTVCAEGVENAETLEFLRGADCDAAQGRHIHEPVSGADLMAYLKTRGKDAVREPGPIRASGI